MHFDNFVSFDSFPFEQKCIVSFPGQGMLLGVSEREVMKHLPSFAKLTVWLGRQMDKKKIWCNINEIINAYVRFNNGPEEGVINSVRRQETFCRSICQEYFEANPGCPIILSVFSVFQHLGETSLSRSH